jgi:hypothetical protein
MWENSYEVTGAPPIEDQRFAVKTVYDYLRAKGKPVPTGKPQVVGHKVDLCSLAKLAFEAGGRAQVVHYSCGMCTFLAVQMSGGIFIESKAVPSFSSTRNHHHLDIGSVRKL